MGGITNWRIYSFSFLHRLVGAPNESAMHRCVVRVPFVSFCRCKNRDPWHELSLARQAVEREEALYG